MFEVAEAYEEDGAVSRQLAPLFLEFVGVRDGENVLMLVAALARCQRLWPKSQEHRGSSASIFLKGSLNMRGHKLPILA